MNNKLWPENAPEGVCVSEREGKISYVNTAAQKLLHLENGWKNKNICELLCGNLYPGETESCAKHCALRRPDSPQREVIFQGKFKTERENRDLRVHCMRACGGSWRTERHLTTIESIS